MLDEGNALTVDSSSEEFSRDMRGGNGGVYEKVDVRDRNRPGLFRVDVCVDWGDSVMVGLLFRFRSYDSEERGSGGERSGVWMPEQ